jgi:WD40 repeat protein
MVTGVLPRPWPQGTSDAPPAVEPERWRPVPGGPVRTDGATVTAAFAEASRPTLVTVARTGTTETWDVADPEQPRGRRVAEGETPGRVTDLSVGAEGALLVLATTDALAVRALPSGRPHWGRSLSEMRLHVAHSGRESLTSASTSGEDVQLWSAALRTGALRFTGLVPLRSTARSLQFSRDGRLLAVGTDDRTVSLLDVSDTRRPRLRGRFAVDSRPPTALAFSPDGRLLATVVDDRSVRLWDVTDPSRAKDLGRPVAAYDGRLTALAFSPDDRLVVTVDDEGKTRLWWRRPVDTLRS